MTSNQDWKDCLELLMWFMQHASDYPECFEEMAPAVIEVAIVQGPIRLAKEMQELKDTMLGAPYDAVHGHYYAMRHLKGLLRDSFNRDVEAEEDAEMAAWWRTRNIDEKVRERRRGASVGLYERIGGGYAR